MTRMIYIKTQFEGFHNYPEAPDEVYFLRNVHRHIFHVKVWIEVKHNNRDVEFFLFKAFVEKLIEKTFLDNKSCEMIADELSVCIKNKYPGRDLWIDVSEDGENGCFCKYGGDE